MMAAAWVVIRRDKVVFERLHRRLLIPMVALGWAFVLFYIFVYRLNRGPVSVPPGAAPWLAVHGTVALFTIVSATVLLLARLTAPEIKPDPLGPRAWLNDRHARVGTIVALLWLFTHLGGILNLYLVG